MLTQEVAVREVAVAVLFAGAALFAPTHPMVKLVPLQRVGSAPPSAYLDPEIFHHSEWIGSPSVNVPMRTTLPGHFWFRYAHCAATARGAFRLTVYESADDGPSPLSRPPVKHLRRYTQTLIDPRPSDNADYLFWAHGRRYYYYHVEIPARQGCTWREGQYLG